MCVAISPPNSRCIKFDEPKQPKRDVELRPIDNERANEILEKNLAERKAKMETLNIEVDDSTQELFDFMYRTLPNKCVWSGTTITFPDSKMSIEEPYDSISLNGMTRNKQVDYIEKQVQSFWNKYRKLNPPKKKKQKKKKKTKSPKSQKSSNNQNNNNHNGHNQSPLRGNGGGNSHLQTEGKENNISLNSPNGRTPGNHGNSTFSRNARSSNPNGSPPPKQSQTAGSNLMQTLSPNTQNAANAQGSVGIGNAVNAVNGVNAVNAGNPNNNNINGFTPQQQQQHLLLQQQQAMQQAAALQNMQNLYGVNAAAMGMANGIATPLNLALMQQGLAGNTMINPNDPNAVNAAAAAAAAAAAQMAMNPNLLAANGMMQFNQFNPAMSSPGQQGQGPNGQQQQGQGQPNPNQQFGAGRGGNELNQYPMAPRHQQRNRNNRDRGRGRGPRGDRGRGRNNGHRGLCVISECGPGHLGRSGSIHHLIREKVDVDREEGEDAAEEEVSEGEGEIIKCTIRC